MNKNTELHYSQIPQINIKRSKFDMSHSHKTSFNVGEIIPVYTEPDIMPGDTIQIDVASLIRMGTPIYPVMDNLFAELLFFFVPNRLVWEHWEEFWGQNDDEWTQNTEYEVPMIKAPAGGWGEKSLADYMGIPTKVENIESSALPFRAYAKIFNDWFRDENLQKSCHLYTDDTVRNGKNADANYNYITDTELGAKPARAAKIRDRFTTALPEPQKGPTVSVPLGGLAPLTGTITTTGTADLWVQATQYTNSNLANYPIKYKTVNGSPATITGNVENLAIEFTGTNKGSLINTGNAMTAPGQKREFAFENVKAEGEITTTATNPNNLYADLGSATAATINSLRVACAIQKYYENAARGGTRYIEYIRSVFGVTSSDARMQRAEFLGAKRWPINMDQILQTSSTDATSPLGNTGGFSCTIDNSSFFTKSFEEHGTLLGLLVLRTEHTYQQGLKKAWSRKKWTDFYNPFFANLGEEAVLNREIYAQGTEADTEVFGYQERWSEYRTAQSYVTADMRSNATGSLDVWHYADDYQSQPYLSSEWIMEPYENVDRTIAVTSAIGPQFVGDFFFKAYYTRPMPIYSVPGLIDHV